MTDDSIWTELSLRVPASASEWAAQVLQDITGNGVTILPPVAAIGPDEGYILDTEAPDLLQAYVYGPVSNERRVEIMAAVHDAGLADSIVGEPGWGGVRDEDWAEKSKD
jgi:hypothetical protein